MTVFINKNTGGVEICTDTPEEGTLDNIQDLRKVAGKAREEKVGFGSVGLFGPYSISLMDCTAEKARALLAKAGVDAGKFNFEEFNP